MCSTSREMGTYSNQPASIYGLTISPVCVFCGRFTLYLLPALLLLLAVEAVPSVSMPILNTITWVAGKIAGFLGSQDLYHSQNMLLHIDSGRYLIIDHSCSGIALTVTLVTGLAAFRCQRIHYYLAIMLFVQCLNVARIVHLFFLIDKDMEQFTFYHLYVWQVVNFSFACLLFSAFLWRLSHNDET